MRQSFKWFSAPIAVLLFFSISAHADWDKIIQCEGGKVWIDVDSNQRSHVQITIEVPAAVNHLTFGTPESIGTRSYSVSGPYASPFKIPGQWITAYTEYTSFYFPNESDRTTLKIQVERRNITACNSYDGAMGRCQGTHSIDYQYAGDVTFGNCRDL